MSNGKVFLVGAGPGDRLLLTVKAEKLIKTAKVVLYDKLVSESIMNLIPKTARLIDVGKTTNYHKVKQQEINKILLNEALSGNDVIRLKGGDPFVFGRGGEELKLLYENNIEFEVISGITSPIAALTYAGIPVTHRDFCSSLHIITGHTKENAPLDIDFNALVKLNGTLIFMMSISNIRKIADGLLKAGIDKNMPCAVVENGTRSCQRSFVSNISNICKTVSDNNVKSPSIIVVGKVCTLANEFNWFCKKPLKNVNILVTQPKEKQSELLNKILDCGGDATLYPCIQTIAIKKDNIPYKDYDIIVFTSDVGVKVFFDYLQEKKLDTRELYGKKIACVGAKTAKVLKSFGVNADFIPTIYDAECLVDEMLEKNFVTKNTKVLLLRANISSPEIVEKLKFFKIPFLDLHLYETKILKNEKQIDIQKFDCVTFTSKSCVEGFKNSLGVLNFNGMNAVCIGKQTAKKAVEFGFNVTISDEATLDSMVQALKKIYRKDDKI